MSPSRRISRPALLTTGVMHLALLWLVLQSPPVVHKLRAVVQYLAPITLRTEAPVKPITQPLPKPELKAVQEIKASVPVPPVIRPQAIELPPEKPPEKPVERPPEKPIEMKIQPVVAPPMPVLRDVVLPAAPPRVVKMSAPEPTPPAPAVEPLVVATPMPLPVVAPTPIPLPTPTPTPTPVATAAPVPVPVPPVPAPEPKAAPVPAPDTPPAPAPSPTPAPTVTPTATPAPTQAPVATPAPAVAPPRPAAITLTEAAPAGGAPPAPTRAVPAAAAPPAGGAAGPTPNLYPYVMKNSPRQRSLAEMANEQLNGNGSRNRLGEAVAGAGKPDCIGPNAGGSLLAIVTIPIAAAMDKCK